MEGQQYKLTVNHNGRDIVFYFSRAALSDPGSDEYRAIAGGFLESLMSELRSPI
jgi:hypothetical protein